LYVCQYLSVCKTMSCLYLRVCICVCNVVCWACLWVCLWVCIFTCVSVCMCLCVCVRVHAYHAVRAGKNEARSGKTGQGTCKQKQDNEAFFATNGGFLRIFRQNGFLSKYT